MMAFLTSLVAKRQRMIEYLITNYHITMQLIIDQLPEIIVFLMRQDHAELFTQVIQKTSINTREALTICKLYPKTSMYHLKSIDQQTHKKCLLLSMKIVEETLITTCQEGHLDMIEWFLERFKEIEDEWEYPFNAKDMLHSVYSEGELKVIKFLLDQEIIGFN